MPIRDAQVLSEMLKSHLDDSTQLMLQMSRTETQVLLCSYYLTLTYQFHSVLTAHLISKARYKLEGESTFLGFTATSELKLDSRVSLPSVSPSLLSMSSSLTIGPLSQMGVWKSSSGRGG